MYCKPETLKLACEKGFRQCTCNAGGYPDCICDGKPWRYTRLDDIQRWVRVNYDLNPDITHVKDNEDETLFTHYHTLNLFKEYDNCLQDWLVSILKVIKD